MEIGNIGVLTNIPILPHPTVMIVIKFHHSHIRRISGRDQCGYARIEGATDRGHFTAHRQSGGIDLPGVYIASSPQVIDCTLYIPRALAVRLPIRLESWRRYGRVRTVAGT